METNQIKRLLVVSENPGLCKYLLSVMEELGLTKSWRVDIKYTVYNDNPAAMISLGASEINMKCDDTVMDIVNTYHMVFSVHCKQIFSEGLVNKIPCFNFHPGFNPFNRGWYPQVFSILNGLPAGATVHKMDGDIDHGDIVDQIVIDVYPDDTSLTVYDRVIEAEKILIRRNIVRILSGTCEFIEPHSEGNYNGINDFRELCKLDLSNTASLKEHIDLLRALSHPPYKNAYFHADGEKYFVNLVIDKES